MALRHLQADIKSLFNPLSLLVFILTQQISHNSLKQCSSLATFSYSNTALALQHTHTGKHAHKYTQRHRIIPMSI